MPTVLKENRPLNGICLKTISGTLPGKLLNLQKSFHPQNGAKLLVCGMTWVNIYLTSRICLYKPLKARTLAILIILLPVLSTLLKNWVNWALFWLI